MTHMHMHATACSYNCVYVGTLLLVRALAEKRLTSVCLDSFLYFCGWAQSKKPRLIALHILSETCVSSSLTQICFFNASRISLSTEGVSGLLSINRSFGSSVCLSVCLSVSLCNVCQNRQKSQFHTMRTNSASCRHTIWSSIQPCF